MSLCKQRSHRRQDPLSFLIQPPRVPNGRHLNAGTTWERQKNLSSWIHHFAACYTTKKFGARKSLLSQPACVCTWQRVAKEGGCVTHVANSISSALCLYASFPFPPLFFFLSATFSHPRFRLRLLFLFCERTKRCGERRDYNMAQIAL